jgi:hypothetical protein
LPVETSSLFAQVIQDHLELKQKNSELEGELPIDRYKTEDPFGKPPALQDRGAGPIEETMDGDEPAITQERAALAWPTDESEAEKEGLWSQSRDFDWGD